MTNTEKQNLLFKLHQDKDLIEQNIDWLARQQIKARTAIYAALRSQKGSLPELCAKASRIESDDLFAYDRNMGRKMIDSIEKHIEELEAGS